jgi:GPH family glycoside/pentoside/hexuronide:cation symporter
VTTSVEKPVLTRREIASYGLGDLACSLGWNAAAAFALYFYTDVALLSAAAVGTLFFATRLFDAALDIGVGVAVDRTRTRWGRARPYLLFGAVPFGLLVVLTFVTPDAGDTPRFAWAAATYFLLGFLLSLTSIPYSAMLPMMARDLKDKLRLSSARSVGTSLGVILVTAMFMPAVEYFGDGDERHGFLVVAAVIGVTSAIMLLVTFANCTERYAAPAEAAVPVRQAVREMFRNRVWLVASGFAILNFVRFGAILALTPFFAIHVLGAPWMISILLPALSGTLLVGAFLAPPILGRLGMRVGNSGAILCAAALYLVLPFVERTPWLFVAVYVTASLILSITMTAIFTMASDAVDYHQQRFGSRNEGLLSAGIAFAIKVGMAFGGAGVAYALAFGGYVPDAVSDEAKRTMSLLYYGVPLVIFALQFLCAQFYPEDALRRPAGASAREGTVS